MAGVPLQILFEQYSFAVKMVRWRRIVGYRKYHVYAPEIWNREIPAVCSYPGNSASWVGYGVVTS